MQGTSNVAAGPVGEEADAPHPYPGPQGPPHPGGPATDFGTPLARGGWQRLPALAIALGVPAVLAIGWALPMLGISPLAFLAADLTTGALRRHRLILHAHAGRGAR